ncbi:type-F conjugative transfer system protein TrbI [Sphingomonas beigongshangi]|uniref:type-F conjugative transfer system protein TrbI n=1 Tax=Sphingomonas beigongshangi TaxID=2782540 RepID=UPI001AEE217B|nr:type-F conjugative transfer system protein TrbI [Sphingomonas beigongshangi]
MSDQPQLDLQAPALPPKDAAARARHGFAGFTRTQLAIGAILILALIWAMWVTKALVEPREDHIVKASLSNIVGEYVSAQARSASPPGQVEAEMRAFMSSLDQELQRRGAGGQVVLVGEAVLTKNVPDITDSLRKAVYASGVRQPRPASAQEMQQLQQQIAPTASAPPMPGPAAPAGATFEPMAVAPSGAVMPQAPSGAAAVPPAGVPGAAITSFGGPDGRGGQ